MTGSFGLDWTDWASMHELFGKDGSVTSLTI